MSTPRRRIVRPPATVPVSPARSLPRVHKLQSRLQKERLALARWMARLKRAFHAMERGQRQVNRLERQLNQLQE